MNTTSSLWTSAGSNNAPVQKPRPLKASNVQEADSTAVTSPSAARGGPRRTVASAEAALRAARRKRIVFLLLLLALGTAGIWQYAQSSGISFAEALRRIRRSIYRFYSDQGKPVLGADNGSGSDTAGTGGTLPSAFLTDEELLEAEGELEARLRGLLPNRDKIEEREREREGGKEKEGGSGGVGRSKGREESKEEGDDDDGDLPELDLTPTVVLVFEGLLAHASYHPSFGYQAIPRPDLADHLLALGDTGCEIIIWSKSRAAETVEALILEKWVPQIVDKDRFRYGAFQRHLRATMHRQYREKFGTDDGASFYVDSAMNPQETDGKYLNACLHLTAVLGREHLLPFSSSSLPASASSLLPRPVMIVPRLDLLPRPRRNVLIVDSNPLTAKVFPHNTLLLPSVEDELKRQALAEEAGTKEKKEQEKNNDELFPPDLDLTLDDVATFVSLFRTAAEARLRREKKAERAARSQRTGKSAAPASVPATATEELIMSHSGTVVDWLAYFKQKTTTEKTTTTTTTEKTGEDGERELGAVEASARVLDAARRIAGNASVAGPEQASKRG